MKDPTSVLVLITFLLKIDIIGLAMLIYLDAEEGQLKFLQVLLLSCVIFACHVMILSKFCLNSKFFFATLSIKKLTDDLLTISTTST